MDDLISRQAAIDAMSCISDSICEQQAVDALCELPSEQQCEYWDSESNYCALYRPSAQPVDAVEVVRCKDCKWREAHYDTDGNAPYWICRNWDAETDADEFCYEAERKTDG